MTALAKKIPRTIIDEAVVLEFRDYSSFLFQEKLSKFKWETGSQSIVMLTKFKEWINSVLKMWPLS